MQTLKPYSYCRLHGERETARCKAWQFFRVLLFAGVLAARWLLAVQPAGAQMQTATEQESVGDSGAAPALADVFSAACRGDETAFGNSLTADNATAYRALPAIERKRLMQRFSLSDENGKPMLSSDQNNDTVIRCERADSSTEFRFGPARVRDNLAFIPITVVNGQSDDFGLVREGGKWRLLSIGLVLLNINQLKVQWAAADLAARENTAAESLQKLAKAVDDYRRTFGKLPESLDQLGPGPTKTITPEKAALVSDSLAAGSGDGYHFLYRITGDGDSSGAEYVLEAVPQDYGTSGRDSFLRDAKGNIHEADNHGASASADDPVWHDPADQ